MAVLSPWLPPWERSSPGGPGPQGPQGEPGPPHGPVEGLVFVAPVQGNNLVTLVAAVNTLIASHNLMVEHLSA